MEKDGLVDFHANDPISSFKSMMGSLAIVMVV